jgi:hypothetical protein
MAALEKKRNEQELEREKQLRGSFRLTVSQKDVLAGQRRGGASGATRAAAGGRGEGPHEDDFSDVGAVGVEMVEMSGSQRKRPQPPVPGSAAAAAAAAATAAVAVAASPPKVGARAGAYDRAGLRREELAISQCVVVVVVVVIFQSFVDCSRRAVVRISEGLRQKHSLFRSQCADNETCRTDTRAENKCAVLAGTRSL